MTSLILSLAVVILCVVSLEVVVAQVRESRSTTAMQCVAGLTIFMDQCKYIHSGSEPFPLAYWNYDLTKMVML